MDSPHIPPCCTQVLHPTSKRHYCCDYGMLPHWPLTREHSGAPSREDCFMEFFLGLDQERAGRINLTWRDSDILDEAHISFMLGNAICVSVLHCSAHLVCFTEYVCKIAKLSKALLIHQDICLIRLLVTEYESSFFRQSEYVSIR